MTIRFAAAIGVIALLAACTTEPAAEPPPDEVAATLAPVSEQTPGDPFDTSGPPVEDDEVDFAARDIEGEPAPDGIVSMIEGMSIPDGAVKVISANMVRHKDVYLVVAAVADTPDGTQILTYLHAPWDQDDIGNGGVTEPLNFAAQQWAPMAGASTDNEAYEIGEQLIVERP